MDILFENNYILTIDHFLEICKRLVNKRFKVCCDLYIVFLFGIIIWSFSPNISLVWEIAYFILIVISIILRFNLYKISAKKSYEQQEAFNNYQPLEQSIYFYDDNFKLIAINGGKSIFSYERIKKIYETNNFLILNIENKITVSVKKDGFNKGNYNDFKKFISNKSNIKI